MQTITKKTQVVTKSAQRITLRTDDTFTLAFPGMVESTPKTLSDTISRSCLELMVKRTTDSNERAKLKKALAI